MSDVQIAVIDQQDTQIVLAVPGVQGATGSSIPSGGTTDQVLRKSSSTDYDANWAQVTSAMIANGTIVNDDINNSAAIAGTKISPDFGGQAVTTTGQVSAARVNVTNNTPPSNGIYLPSANNVAISAGGSGRLFVDASGIIGVKRTTQGGVGAFEQIQIGGNAAAGSLTTFFGQNNGSAGGIISNAYYDASNNIVYSQTSANFGISRLYLSDGTLVFSNAAAGVGGTTASLSERLRITSTGTVNIVGAGSGGSTQAVSFNGSAPVDSLVLTSGGLLGVGTSTPESYKDEAEQLVVSKAGNCGITVASATNGVGALYFADGTSGSDASRGGLYYSHIDNSMQLLADGSARVYITSGGLVGIGTTSPSETLHVVGNGRIGNNTTNPDFTVVSSNTGNPGADTRVGTLKFAANANNVSDITAERNCGITATTGSDERFTNLDFYTSTVGGGAARVRIDSSGRVGIGTTSPGTRLCTYDTSVGNTTQFRVGFSDSFAWDISRDNAATGDLTFKNSSGGAFSERARIDSSGRLLVGTSTARSNFFNTTNITPGVQIEQTGNGGALAIVRQSADTGGAFIALSKSRGTSVGSNTLPADGDDLGAVAFLGSDGSEFVAGAIIAAQVDGTPGADDMPGRLVFSTTADGASSPTERMRIGSSGNIGIGQADTAGSRVSVTATGSQYAGYFTFVGATGQGIGISSTGTTTAYPIYFFNDGTLVGSVYTTSSSTAYNTSSDYRLKENVTEATDGIARLQQLKPSRFNFIADPGKTVDGFLAHEVQTVVPEAITGEKDAVDQEGNPIYQGIDQSKLVPLLTAALQEAVAKIETLEARLTAAGI